MNDAIISWYLGKKDSGAATSFVSDDDFYCGTIISGQILTIEFQIWNNRYGLEDVEDLSDFNIFLKFDHIEDAAIFQYMTAIVNNKLSMDVENIGNGATITVPDKTILSGKANDGSETFTDNFMTLSLTINIPAGENIKINDLKTLNLSIVKI